MWPSEQTASRLYDLANWGLIAGLVLGVISTGIVVWMGNVKEDYLKRELAATNERAAHADERARVAEQKAESERLARVELEESIAWRRLTAESSTTLSSHLTRFSGQHVWLIYNLNDVEAFGFATDLAKALPSAKWVATEPEPIMKMAEGPIPLGANPVLERGVLVTSTDDAVSREAAAALVKAIVSLGFDAKPSSKAALHPAQPTPIVYVSVEPRPEGAQGEAKLRELRGHSNHN
jgi:hypothetical protein